MTQITILSGTGLKEPACILVDSGTTQILLDFGERPVEGGIPELPDLPRLAGVVVSHDHSDHVGGLTIADLGVPVYISEAASHAVPSHYEKRIIAEQGHFTIGDIPITTGRDGHALGGLWVHIGLAIDRISGVGATADGGRQHGFFYSGDFSLESEIFPFDPPPPASCAALDCSYGFRTDGRDGVMDQLIAKTESGQCLLPVPPSGRALEIALKLEELGFHNWAMDDRCWQAFDRLTHLHQHDEAFLARLQPLCNHSRSFDDNARLLLAHPPCASFGTARDVMTRWLDEGLGERSIIYTGHIRKPAQEQVRAGIASQVLWNVHPRIQDVGRVLQMIDCRSWIPLFSALNSTEDWKEPLAQTNKLISLPLFINQAPFSSTVPTA